MTIELDVDRTEIFVVHTEYDGERGGWVEGYLWSLESGRGQLGWLPREELEPKVILAAFPGDAPVRPVVPPQGTNAYAGIGAAARNQPLQLVQHLPSKEAEQIMPPRSLRCL